MKNRDALKAFLAAQAKAISPEEDVIVIRWDRFNTGQFSLYHYGQPLHATDLTAFIDALTVVSESATDGAGYVCFEGVDNPTEDNDDDDLPFLK